MISHYMRAMISGIVLGAFVFIISGFITPAQAVSYSPSSSAQFASIARAIESLQHLLNIAKSKALSGSPYLAQVTGSGSCPSGYHYMSDTGGYCMSDTSGSTCQPMGGGATYTCPNSTTTYPSPSPGTTTTSSCSSSLIALLGDGCHQMYTDSIGVIIYCDGPMTKSAKPGDTAITPGCSSPSGTTTTTTGSSSAGLYATISGSDIVLNWTDFYAGENEYRIERRTTGGTWTQTGTSPFLAGGQGTYRDVAVPSGSYEYRVKPCTSTGCFGESNTSYITIGGSSTSTTTAAPTTTGGLSAVASGSDIVLNWTDFYTGENEYRIERRIGTTGTWTQIGTSPFLAGGSGTYRDVAVPSGTYEYHVRPCTTTTGCFSESNSVGVTAGGSSTSTVAPRTAIPPPVIGNIVASNITSNSATISWTTDIAATTKIEYGINTPTSVLSDGSFVLNHTMYISGLSASTTYIYNVVSESQDYYRTTFSNKTFATLSSGNTTTTTTSSCSSSLIALLGDGCHFMYTDTIGVVVYCDGPMTKSAKPGDTVTSAGCTSPSGGGTAPTTTTSSSCTASLINLLGSGCHWMSTDYYCDGPMTKSARSNDTATTPGCINSAGTATSANGALYTTISGSDIVLTWTDFYAGENEYRIERRTTGGTWVQIGTSPFLAGGQGTYRDPAVPSGSSYEYRVKPCTSTGCFGESNTAYGTSGGSTSTTTSCSSSLIALLGDGCHYMYTNTAGQSVYCDGPMTKSAKQGDTVTSGGCYSQSGNTSACSANVSQSSCTANTGCSWMSGGGFSYCDTRSSYAGDSNSCPGFSYSRWDASGKRYCQMNQARACQYTYPDYLDTAKYSSASCPVQDTTTNTVSSCDTNLTLLLGTGCHQMYTDSAGNTIYCDSAMTKSAKQGDTVTSGGCNSPSGNTATSTQSGFPATPGGLSATLQASGNVNLVWNDYANNETEYRVEWKNSSGVWVVIGTTPLVYGGTGLYTDRPSSGRTHEYRVKACHATGCSPESNIATITIGPVGPGPVIANLSPGAGSIGSRVTITGTGFSAAGNRINFDKGVIMDIPSSSDGTTLVFTVPDDRVPLCAVTEPRCLLPAPYNLVTPGVYSVSVTNANGTSGTFSFNVIERVASVFAVDLAGTYPKSGQTAVDTGARIKVKFTKEFDSASMAQEFFRISKDTAPTVRLNGTFAIAAEGFEFIPSQEFESNAMYTYTVLATLKDKGGMSLASPFSASFAVGSTVRTSGALAGRVTDSDGTAVARALVYIFSYQNSFWRTIETDVQGSFQTSIPAGTYVIEVHPPFERSDLNRAAPREIKIVGGDKQAPVFVLAKPIKIITGVVGFSSGSPITDAEVGAYASETKQWANVSVDANGRYTLKVGSGTWLISMHPRDAGQAAWLWNEPPRRVTFSKDQNPETKTIDFIVPVNNTTVTVMTIDETGAALSDVGVVADSGSARQQSPTSFFDFIPPEFRVTDGKGRAVFTLRSGTYYVRAYASSDRGYFNPDEQQISVSGGDAKEIKMVFRKKQQTQSSMIRGITKLEEGILVDAFIWAWSERGGFVSAKSDENGTFALTVLPNDRWHVGAGKEYKGFAYKSTEIVVDVKGEPMVVDMVLTKQNTTPLPPTVSVTQTAQTQVVAQTTDGAQMTLPPASAASSSTVQLEINPTVDAPTQAGTKVMSTVYDVSVRDSAGKDITKLTHEAEIIIPYSEQELKDQGVSEDAIVPSFFDEKTGTWTKIDNYTIDKERNVIIARVDHLTRFAITAAADITPPSAPTESNAQSSTTGKITVTWRSPAKDFDYAKIYRSSKEGELGLVRGATIRGAQFIDEEGISDNTVYYYTVRAVDMAGNESTNTAQTRIVASGTSGRVLSIPVKSAGVLLRTLRRGMSGDDVKLLQSVLTADGVYTDEVTGFFGKLTEAAVIRFQEKYATEVLKPAGLSKGSGIVGPGTRKKIGDILKK